MPWGTVTLPMGVAVLSFSSLETLKSLEQVLSNPTLMDTSPPLHIGIREGFSLEKTWRVSSLHHDDLSVDIYLFVPGRF